METWKSIMNYEDCYEISSMGKVKSLERRVGHYLGGELLKKERILKHGIRDGYGFVVLSKNNKQKKMSVHRLVAIAFLSNLENKKTVNHKNGNKLDNRLENLEWATYSENEQHSIRTGLNDKRIKTKQFSKKGVLIKIWESMREVERQLGIQAGHIGLCCLKKKNHKTAGGYIWESCLKD